MPAAAAVDGMMMCQEARAIRSNREAEAEADHMSRTVEGGIRDLMVCRSRSLSNGRGHHRRHHSDGSCRPL